MTNAAEQPPGGLRVAAAVVELAGGDATTRCLTEMAREGGLSGLWLALRGRGTSPSAAHLLEEAGRTVPERRRSAILAMGGAADIVLLVEDTTLPDPGYVDVLRGAFGDPGVQAVWGPVSAANDLAARYRALARLEYGRFDGSRPDVGAPPGNCLAFRCEPIRAYCQTRPEGLVEADAARWLEERGRIRFSADFRSTYSMEDAHGAALATRFSHGRLYGGTHRAEVGGGARVADVAKAVALPAVLSARGVGAALRAGGLAGAVREMPWIVAMATAWSAGEATGAFCGPGDSREAWV